MAALGTATVTVQKNTRRIDPRNCRSQLVNIAFGDGVSTYPSGGIPLPSGAGFGFSRGHIELIDIVDWNLANFQAIPTWDSVHGTLRLNHPTQQTAGAGNRDGVEYSTSDVPPNGVVLVAQVWGW